MGSEESIPNRPKEAGRAGEGGRRSHNGGLAPESILTASMVLLPKDHSPNLIDTYLEPGFTELKKLILNSVLGKADGIPPKTFDLADQHIQDSGLGLFHSADTSKAAFLASFVECVSVLASEVSLKEPNIDADTGHEASRCL